MVKGTTRRVVVIKAPDKDIFDEAIFIVKDDILNHGVTNEEILREAQSVAEKHIAPSGRFKRLSRIPAPFFTLLGAGGMAIIWFFSQL